MEITTFYESGAADSIIAAWVEVLERDAVGLVDTNTIYAEADAITNYIDTVK